MIGRERWYRGGHGETTSFDWYQPAQELNVPLERARALYEEAMATHPGSQRAEDLYLDWLRDAALQRRRVPGRRTLAMRAEAETGSWRRRTRLDGRPIAPGKRTRTMRTADETGSWGRQPRLDDAPTAPGRQMRTAALASGPVQRKANSEASDDSPAELASRGVAGGGGRLPYFDLIQESFGHHDVSGVVAHQGAAASEAARLLGAAAFAFRDSVAFDGSPDLHTAAHEAAHIIQQRSGIQLEGGIDRPGDAYERHADAVADAVVAGKFAAPLLDQIAGGGGSRGSAVQRKPNAKAPLSLPDGVNMQIMSDGVAIIRVAWIDLAPDKAIRSNRVFSPSRSAEILRNYKASGFLYWIEDSKIQSFAQKLGLSGTWDSKKTKFQRATIAFGAYAVVGPPPDVNVIFATDGRGLSGILRQSVVIPGPIVAETEVELSQPVRNELWTALEQFTGMPLPPATKAELVDNPHLFPLRALPEMQGLKFSLPQEVLTFAYGKKAWNDHVDHPKPAAHSGGGALSTGGAQFSKTLSEEDRKYFLAWTKQVASAPSGKPGDSFITQTLIDKLKEIDKDPDLKQKVIAKLKGGAPDANAKPLDTALIESVLNAIRTEKAYANLGMAPPAGGSYKPLFDEPVRGTIINRGSHNYVGQDTEFYFETQNRRDAFAIPYVDVRWVVTRKDKPQDHLEEGRTSHVEFKTPDYFTYEWKATGIYTIHAFVTHSFYQPAYATPIDVEVKTEAERSKELNDPAFKGLKGGTTYGTPGDEWPFDVSWFNTLFGNKKEEYGKKSWGTTPDGFKRMSYEDRVNFIATDKKRLQEMIAAHTNAKGVATDARWADMVSYAKSRLKSLEETEGVLGAENKGSTFFDAHATFLSRKNGIPDKVLKLVASAKKEGDAIKTVVHDFTQLYEPMDYTFSSSGNTFEKSIEATFVDLCKSYPPGRVSALFEALDDNVQPLKRTIGFELDTGTAWKDIKSVAYNPTVMVVVNIVGAATMVFLPVTAPVLFPMLATYNSIEAIDNMAQLEAKGHLTWGNVAKGVSQIGLNFLPYVGAVKVVANMGKVAMYTIEGVTIAGMGVLMTIDGVEQIRRLRDKDISEIGKLDDEVREIERTNPSDPKLPEKRRQLDEMIKQAQERSTQVIQEMAKSGAVMLMQVGALKGLQAHMINTSIKGLKAKGLFQHVKGVEPYYDAKTGTIKGDQTKLDTGKLARLQQQYAVDMAAKQTELQNVLGTAKVELSDPVVLKAVDALHKAHPNELLAFLEALKSQPDLTNRLLANFRESTLSHFKPTGDSMFRIHGEIEISANKLASLSDADLPKLVKLGKNKGPVEAYSYFESTSTGGGKPGARLRFKSRLESRARDVVKNILDSLGIHKSDARAKLFENMSEQDTTRLWDLFNERGYHNAAVRKQAAAWAYGKNPKSATEFVAELQFYDAEVSHQAAKLYADTKAEVAKELTAMEAMKGSSPTKAETRSVTRTVTAKNLGRPLDVTGEAAKRAALARATENMAQTKTLADGTKTTMGAESADHAWETNKNAQTGDHAAGMTHIGTKTDAELPGHVKSVAASLSFSNEAESSTHAHKHAGELPTAPTPANEMASYLNAARELIRTKDGVVRHNQNGSRSVVFEADGMRVIVSVGDDGNAAIATFGKY